MPGDRRYRQQGYRDSAPKPAPPRPERSQAPRPAGMLGRRAVSRCGECGTLLPPLTDPLARCPKCKLPLHACKQCSHFDPGHRFECTQPIPGRIADKRARNECAAFSLRVMVERDASAGSGRPEDARRAFENLFER